MIINFDELDNYLDENKIEDWRIEKLLSLLQTSTVGEREFFLLREEIEEFKMFYDRYLEIENYLKERQIDPIKQGLITSMSQITKAIDNIIQ